MKASKIIRGVRNQNVHTQVAFAVCEGTGHLMTSYLDSVLNKRRAPQMGLEQYLSGIPLSSFQR